jgi:GR25 family glycosyltransferase involved in LPS biosynthesis
MKEVLCYELCLGNQLQVHVIHYTRLAERRGYMEDVLSQHFPEVGSDWMLEHDREDILEAYERGELGSKDDITASSVSLILKHLAVYQKVVAAPEKVHLILEDDVRLDVGFLSALDRCLKELPKVWDLFFVGLGCDLHVPWWRRRPGKRVYYRGYNKRMLWGGGGCSRCTEGYLIHPDFARRLLESRFGKPPFSCPIDWHLNKAGVELKAQSYWAEPPLLTQGAFESWRKNPLLNPGYKD